MTDKNTETLIAEWDKARFKSGNVAHFQVLQQRETGDALAAALRADREELLRQQKLWEQQSRIIREQAEEIRVSQERERTLREALERIGKLSVRTASGRGTVSYGTVFEAAQIARAALVASSGGQEESDENS